jgi:protein-tyrosine phosphatase
MQPEIYWIPSPWPGRLAVLPHPRGEDWLEDEIGEFRQMGVNVMVSALESREAAELGLSKEEEICRKNGIEFISFPIPDGGVPASPKATFELARTIQARLEAGKNVAIHCRAGVGRAPVLAACVLVLAGIDVDAAFQGIQAVRGARVPDKPEQKEWVERFALDHKAQISTR